MTDEPLYIYLAMFEHAINIALVLEENGIQLPVYYISKRLFDAQTRYPTMEKLTYALVISLRKLWPYFHAKHIHFFSD